MFTTKFKIYPLIEGKRQIEAWRLWGEKVVFTNGVFDILHPGHIHLLETARAMADRLIVGVNTDNSVKRLQKDADRPIRQLEDRQRMLAALECVDVIIAFDEDTPAELIAEISPDVLVKGGDYTEAEVAGAETVRARGGEVRIVPTLEGYGTTEELRRIRASV